MTAEHETLVDNGEKRRMELVGGLLLIAATIAALIAANSPLSALYDSLLDVPFEVRLGEYALSKPILLWINDGLMAVFFLLVGVELKRELMEGDLDTPKKVAIPLAAALGGVAIPVLIYLAVNADGGVRVNGWAIPAATDIAFAVGMLALLGDRVPSGLRTFLLSLAVFDDLAAILIVAVAYTDKISWTAQGVALGFAAVLLILNRLKVTRYGVYLLFGMALWVAVLKSGVHATIAGVVLGLTIPRRPKNALGYDPLQQVEHVLRPWVTYLVLPLFAFVNAGIALSGLGLDALLHPVTLGVFVGLVLGKVIGVFGVIMALRALGLTELTEGTRPVHYLGIAALAGIGFTMSLFIGGLAFEDAPRAFESQIRIGVLGATVCAAVTGLTILMTTLPRAAAAESGD